MQVLKKKRNTVGVWAHRQVFHSFFEFSQTFMYKTFNPLDIQGTQYKRVWGTKCHSLRWQDIDRKKRGIALNSCTLSTL